ncbi:hypothetical protein [Amaricoccus sp.]|uniref:hypothetical protein n=1 Tax=Amaricoccus sp. TaxID=1872485 RepID=UPI00261728AD|nr:hypothetical protein [Amaricoccus sp.]HRO10387.1 hypothetical protein [Amaricoccus sp.]
MRLLPILALIPALVPALVPAPVLAASELPQPMTGGATVSYALASVLFLCTLGVAQWLVGRR